MGKITVGQIINANSTDSWLSLGQKFVTAAGTATISKIPQLSGVMTLFGTTMKIYSGVLKVLTIYEKVVPIINLAVKINDIITFNFAAIGSLVQDVLSMLGGLAIAFANAGVMALKEFILNFPFYFPDVPIDKINSVANKVNDTKKTLKESYKNNLQNLNTRNSLTSGKRIDALSTTLTSAYTDLDSLINAHITALIHTTETPTQWKALILSTTLTDLTTSTLPTGIEVTDNEIYEYILVQIQNLLDKIAQAQKEQMLTVSIDISEDVEGLSPVAISSMNKLKNIYLDMAKQSEIFYKDQVFRQTTYRENNDIIILIKSFKDYMIKEIEKKKRKYYTDMQKIFKNTTDIEEIRSQAISIIFEPIDWYDIFDLSIMQAIKKSIEADNNEADLYDTNSRFAHLSGSLNDGLMNAAANAFNENAGKIATYISDKLIPVSNRNLESGQVDIAGLSTCVSDSTAALSSYISGMGTFNLSLILSNLKSIINGLSIAASINESIPGVNSLCIKLNEVKNELYNQVNETLINDIIKDYFKNFNVSYTYTDPADKLLVRNYIIKSVELYAQKILGIANEAIHQGIVPCRNCVSCTGLKNALTSALNTIKIPNLKYSLNKALEAGINALPFTGDSETNKSLVIAYLANSTTITMLNTIRDSTINDNVMNAMLEKIFKDQQFMMIDAIRSRMGI
jgi:hypothetical protein